MQKILMVTEGAAGADSAFCILRTMIKTPDSAVVVRVNSAPGRSGADSAETGDEGIVGRCRSALAQSGSVKERALERNGDPSREILRVAREERVDLIIIGRERGRGIRRFFAPDMMKEVERYASVPVLVGRA